MEIRESFVIQTIDMVDIVYLMLSFPFQLQLFYEVHILCHLQTNDSHLVVFWTIIHFFLKWKIWLKINLENLKKLL